MTKGKDSRLLEFKVDTGYRIKYRLYVSDGKPIRIMRQTSYSDKTIDRNNERFENECEKIISILFIRKNPEILKNLYNSLEEGKWKKLEKDRIEELIDEYEKGLAILKS